MRKVFLKYSLVLLSLLAAACVQGADHKAANVAGSSKWHAGKAVAPHIQRKKVEVAWWESFNDPVLTGLIKEAARHNHDLRIALASMEEARALRRGAASGYYPVIGATGRAEREGLSSNSNNPNNNNTQEKERDTYSASLDASWELDIFGKTRLATKAADARLDASKEGYHDVMLSVLAEVARNYFEVRGAQKRIETTKRNIELLKEAEGIAKVRFDNGAVSELDVMLARGERESFAANLPNIEAEMTAGIYRLSALTGKPPEHHLARLNSTAPLPMPPDKVPVGLKTDVLKRRPDVRRAGHELTAANAEVGVATAAMFPSLSLTGSIGGSARRFSEVFTSGGWNYLVGGALTQPLFQGGRLWANREAADARSRQAVAAYEKSILTALEDAEASLLRYGKEWQTLEAFSRAEASRRQAYNIARLRYESGDEGFLAILEAERALVDVHDEVIQSETRILTKLTQLYKALGGGWESWEQAKN